MKKSIIKTLNRIQREQRLSITKNDNTNRLKTRIVRNKKRDFKNMNHKDST